MSAPSCLSLQLWVSCQEGVGVCTPVWNRHFAMSTNLHFLLALGRRSRAKREMSPPCSAFPRQGVLVAQCTPCHCLCHSSWRTSALKAVRHLPTALNLLSSEKKEETSAPRAAHSLLGAEGFACLCCTQLGAGLPGTHLLWCPNVFLQLVLTEALETCLH